MSLPDRIYYLIRKGTNIRILDRDNTPVKVREDYVDEQLDFWGDRVNGGLEAIEIDEFHKVFK